MSALNPTRPASLALFAVVALLASRAPAQFAPGNLVVVRVGDGSAALSNAATAAFLDEYTPAGVLVQSVPLPTVPSGPNRALTNSGTATSEGFLNLSADGHYLLCAGYDAAPGTAAIAGTTSALVNRVIARIDLNGNINTTTALNNAFSAGNPRSASSDDGTDLWAAGSVGGIQYATLGGTTAVALNATAPTNNRVVQVVGGQLYCSSASGAFQGVSTVGTGLPTTPGQTITILPGFPTAAGPSSYDYFFADANTLYVADDRTTIAGGIQKWTFSGGTWTQQYTLNLGTPSGCRGLTGTVSGGVATLYATTTFTNPSGNTQLVTVTDTGAGSTVSVIATALANTAMRGVRLIPSLGGIARIVHGCGSTTIATTGLPRIGGTVTTTLGNITGVPVIGIGFTIGSLPFCSCTIGHDWLLTVFGSSLPLSIPSNRSVVGLRVGIQGIDAFGTGGCAAPPITLTDTMVVTIG